jgi:hypothetical protein
MKHADTHNILYPLQHGFRKDLSCETQETDGYKWIHVQEGIDGPKQVGTNDGKATFGFVLSRQILTQPRWI